MIPGAGIFRTLLPKGFTSGGINCGVRSYRPDLGIIISAQPSVAAGVFTKNTCKAAPISYCIDLLPTDNIRAIITNSGQANAATGEQGIIDNLTMVECVAKHLDCHSHQVLAASTGVIGQQLEIDKITTSIPALLNETSTIAEKFALAILTTDLIPKTVYKTVELSHGSVHITGICKGSGMIHPNMATMLGYLLTDAKLTMAQTQTLLKQATDCSFNMISVDGETSTNDCVFMLANGCSNVAITDEADWQLFQDAINEIAITLAKSIAHDGEGATKLIEASISGLDDLEIARQLAKALITSALIKTAIHGESPNWGRIVARLGAEQIPEALLAHCEIMFQGELVFANGKPFPFNKEQLKNKMQQDTIYITVDFKHGPHHATAWGCDLSARYVKINAEYLS